MPKKILVVPDIHGETFWRKPVREINTEPGYAFVHAI